MMDARIETLKQRHAKLDREIVQEQARPVFDPAHVGALKRRKLALRDVIVLYEKTRPSAL
ncbi:YdcH family protein [Candidatus Viadribacter manganicus]|uniref:DUF465 domain-containing protein n=1 Tax=Candidatus Viadribacter manganicus TaxID=1759059 RepID=A0A1B1AGL7_9PROT|nr:DUF465 domain-containing protein [Candidatus Viadribacter manganicus]ANP45697.1 hypothetical protein ATE48_07070 [Candidatus Viadribacter manganicus]